MMYGWSLRRPVHCQSSGTEDPNNASTITGGSQLEVTSKESRAGGCLGFGHGQFEACGVQPARILSIPHSDAGIEGGFAVGAGPSLLDRVLSRSLRPVAAH